MGRGCGCVRGRGGSAMLVREWSRGCGGVRVEALEHRRRSSVVDQD